MTPHTQQSLAVAGVLVVFAVPGFAQTNNSLSLDRTAFVSASVRVYAASGSHAYENVPAASNITVAEMYRPLVRAMLERSPTFRRQWTRLARATSLAIDVSCEVSGERGAAARTIIRRELGVPVAARVIIVHGPRAAELIAHELEHVIEQLDGVDLDQKSDVRGSGVRHINGGQGAAFETTRAIETGLRVAEDVGERRR